MAPAQRADVWLDLSNSAELEEMKLIHLPMPLDNMMGGGMMGNNSDNSLPYKSQFDILKILLGESRKNDAQLPDKLSTSTALNPADAANRTSPRTRITMIQKNSTPFINYWDIPNNCFTNTL